MSLDSAGTSKEAQRSRIRSGSGFIAALDQSGGSTPGALQRYGIGDDDFNDDTEMFNLMHEMRSRIVMSPSFDGTRVLGAILFADTLDRSIGGRESAEYLWNVKEVVPFVKIDKGLEPEAQGVQRMRPIPDLDAALEHGTAKGVFGTKMRSVIALADLSGIAGLVEQQFDIAHAVIDAGLVPIIEPEVDINSAEKPEAEGHLKGQLIRHLDALEDGHDVMLKLSLPTVDDLYADLVSHPRVLRVVALSGGYSRQQACTRLATNHGVIASFSRALTEGLSVGQSEGEFDAALDAAIGSIYAASIT